MTRLKYILVLFLLPCKLYAQLFYPSFTIENVNAFHVEQFCKKYFEDFQSNTFALQLISEKHTQHSNHYTFEILVEQIPIYNACIKVNTSHTGKIISVKRECPASSYFKRYSPIDELIYFSNVQASTLFTNYWPNHYILRSKKLVIYTGGASPELVCKMDTWDKQYDKTILFNKDGKRVLEIDETRNALLDSVVQVRIFYPDPLTTLMLSYGGLYKDQSDTDMPWMLSAYKDTQVIAIFDNLLNTFYCENDLVKIDDFESPLAPPVSSTTPQFMFNRSQTGFEDANVLFHISAFHDHISSLGYDTLMDVQVTVDAHGQFGTDNSVFNRNGGNPTISFGTGGVDDAEDADVIIHEYCHGISWSANDNSGFTPERAGLDEGLADYFATSYSRAISNYKWDSMFTWDGHNEFWAGRNAATTNTYPSSGNIYSIGELWNGAMSAIWTDLGRIVTDKLMLESLHFFTNQTTLPEAALYVLQADTILFGGLHTPTICMHFKNRNILDAQCNMVGLHEKSNTNKIIISNTLAFANNAGDAILQFAEPSKGELNIYSVNGSLVFHNTFLQQKLVTVSPSSFSSGLYVVQITTEHGVAQFKLMKF